MSEDTPQNLCDESTDAEIELTPEQEDALVLDRNITITAGAGTGKTTALTQRYLEYLRDDPDATPEDIVTITFTRKAAAELQTRVREEVYDQLEAAETDAEYERWRTVLDELDDGYTHTIHAFCSRLLRENAIQAPVPMAFDVLDEDDAADLQRQVVVEYIDENQSDEDVSLLSRLFGSHGRLVDVLSGLLSNRPESEAWLDVWGDRTVEDYTNYLWEHVCDLDSEMAQSVFEHPKVESALTTAQRFTREEFDVAADADGVQVLRRVAAVVEGHEHWEDGREYQRACRELYDLLETSSGGLYSSVSHHLIGTKAAWKDETNAYSDCKDALNAILERLEDIEDELATTPGELERNSAHYVFALARTFESVLDAYEAEKDREEALDFPDLISTTTEFLQQSPDVRTSLRESFGALMVDEFQDTDQRQWELVALLAELMDDDVDTDNVFLVGDKKQSIYGFRGADVTTFESAKAALRHENERLGRDAIPRDDELSPTELELSGNFRTLDSTLTFLNELFERVFEPFGDEYEAYEAEPQELSFERDRLDDIGSLSGTVEYLVVPEDQDDAANLLGEGHPVADAAAEHAIAGEAEALGARLANFFAEPPEIQDEDTGEVRDATPEDAAILLRRRTHLDRYQRALDEHDVPYTVVSGVGFYDTPEVQTLINLLRVLADPTDEISLYGVLRSPLFGFSDNRLASLAATDTPLWKALSETDDPELEDAAELLDEWRELAGCVHSETGEVVPWNQVLTQVFDDTGYLVSIGADERGQQAVANVEKFRDEIREWSEGGTRTAASLLRRIDRQTELDPREGDAEIPEGAEGVRIMTIHAAKGLEFPVVVVPDLGSGLNFGRSVDEYGYVRLVSDHDDDPFLAVGGPDPTDPFEVQKTTAHNYADSVGLPRERAEAKRLLYVACTRARDHLLLCGTHDFQNTEDELVFADVPDPEEASAWRDWLQPVLLDRPEVQEGLARDGWTEAAVGGASYVVQLPTEPVNFDSVTGETCAQSKFPQLELPDIPELDQQVRMTATQLVEAASDYSDDSGAVTTPPSTARDQEGLSRQDFGTIVHRLLELDHSGDSWQKLAKRIASVNGYRLTEEELANVLEHAGDAQSFLDADAERYDGGETYTEVTVSVDIDELHVVGDIDHLRVTDEAFVITDYKTNRIGSRTAPDLADHYRPQMASYALALLEQDPTREVVVNLRFTDVGETESFRWDIEDYTPLTTYIAEIVEANEG